MNNPAADKARVKNAVLISAVTQISSSIRGPTDTTWSRASVHISNLTSDEESHSVCPTAPTSKGSPGFAKASALAGPLPGNRSQSRLQLPPSIHTGGLLNIWCLSLQHSTSQTTYQLDAGYWNRGLQVHEPLLFLLMEKRRLRASCRHPPSPPRLGDTISSSYRELFTSASAGFRQTIPNRSGMFQ
ncbi:hypothetical protein Anapl_00526 [Anas platyrhynchos]|uniref:Uncharacterized protein n=1 Tax=Anas platyrhynchos TaxID=8839 RepID=R0LZT5_ANAPL|nr:hypothetical protein Anapl_00526 [Anas platyrhynchos]